MTLKFNYFKRQCFFEDFNSLDEWSSTMVLMRGLPSGGFWITHLILITNLLLYMYSILGPCLNQSPGPISSIPVGLMCINPYSDPGTVRC